MHPENPSFHAHHPPMGALASFTFGAHGQKAGMGIALPGPYPGVLNVGYQTVDNVVHLLPLFEGSDSSESERYVDGQEGTGGRLSILKDVKREYGWASDRLSALGVCFEVLTPFFEIPDPSKAQLDELARASCPVVHVNVHFTNDSAFPLKGIFALGIDHRWSSLGDCEAGGLVGAVSQQRIGFASNTEGARSFIDFDCISAMNREHQTANFLLGPTAGLELEVPPGETKTLEIVLGFYVGEVATYNREMRYYYTRHFSSLLQVLDFGLRNRNYYITQAKARDEELATAMLNDEQKFLVAHATRGYYASTQWLWNGEKSIWVVNEGEYLMMNTFDLTVDMLFFEMRMNPWTIKNVLQQFVEDYSFVDKVFSHENPQKRYSGGISFTHDMGVMNHWSPKGRSAYEVAGLDRKCFSHMTCEQLTNWVLCASIYVGKTDDHDFFERYMRIFIECFNSLKTRDNPIAELRNGLMGFESARTEGGGEITTYDSLDHSLGQARNNVYLAGKMWASYVLLHSLFTRKEMDSLAEDAFNCAKQVAHTLSQAYSEELGFIPAILEGNNRSAIIPAIEALVYPYVLGLSSSVSESGPFGEYIRCLKFHLKNILHPNLCLYNDGGWKLSSTADNSWQSKIALCQFVAREILGFDFGDDQLRTDLAHARWQREGASASACSDQFRSGVAHGSLYYPRCVTNILWLTERK